MQDEFSLYERQSTRQQTKPRSVAEPRQTKAQKRVAPPLRTIRTRSMGLPEVIEVISSDEESSQPKEMIMVPKLKKSISKNKTQPKKKRNVSKLKARRDAIVSARQK